MNPIDANDNIPEDEMELADDLARVLWSDAMFVEHAEGCAECRDLLDATVAEVVDSYLSDDGE